MDDRLLQRKRGERRTTHGWKDTPPADLHLMIKIPMSRCDERLMEGQGMKQDLLHLPDCLLPMIRGGPPVLVHDGLHHWTMAIFRPLEVQVVRRLPKDLPHKIIETSRLLVVKVAHPLLKELRANACNVNLDLHQCQTCEILPS